MKYNTILIHIRNQSIAVSHVVDETSVATPPPNAPSFKDRNPRHLRKLERHVNWGENCQPFGRTAEGGRCRNEQTEPEEDFSEIVWMADSRPQAVLDPFLRIGRIAAECVFLIISNGFY